MSVDTTAGRRGMDSKLIIASSLVTKYYTFGTSLSAFGTTCRRSNTKDRGVSGDRFTISFALDTDGQGRIDPCVLPPMI